MKPEQLALFEIEPNYVRPQLPKIFVYENLNINQKINFHSNDIYAPHFTCQYSWGMANQLHGPNKWQCEQPGEGRPKYQKRYFRNLKRRAKRLATILQNFVEEPEIKYEDMNIHQKINSKAVELWNQTNYKF